MGIWYTDNGKIAKTEDGKIYICDDCPCGTCCPGAPSSILISHTRFSAGGGTRTGTLILNNPSEECRAQNINPNFFAESCVWYDKISNGSGQDERVWLYVHADPSAPFPGNQPRWSVAWGLVNANPLICTGFQNRMNKSPSEIPCTGPNVLGFYGVVSVDECTLS